MNTKNYTIHIIFAAGIFLFCLFSCIDRIDISTEASPPRVVIYGYITTDTTQHAIRITRSSGFFETTKPEGISHAAVSISCDEGVFELEESSEEKGLYLTLSDVYGISGKTYTLNVALDFNGDGTQEEYEATSYLPFPATLDSVAITVSDISDEFLQVLVWGSLPEESSNNFSFHLLRNGVVLNDSLRGFRFVRDDYVVNNKFAALPVFALDPEREKYKLLPGDTVAVQVESITSEYAIFMQNAQREMYGPIPLFGGPPANVKTNIQCLSSDSKTGISGFFTAYSKHKAHTIYDDLFGFGYY